MDTIKFNKRNVKMVAHRGVSGLECENTCAAFVAAGNRSYYGIECDTHPTVDGKFIVIHDHNTARVSGESIKVEEVPAAALSYVRLYDCEEGVKRSDLVIPMLADYARICHRYDKVAVLELKGAMTPEACAGIIEILKAEKHLEQTVFIAFDRDTCLEVRRQLPDATIQFLTSTWEDSILDWLVENRFDLDINQKVVTKDLVDAIHSKGLEINCWTVNDPERGEELAEMGVDYITTNILE